MSDRTCCVAECEVENVPEYALVQRYWIVTPVHGRLWFWGAYSRRTDAEKCLEGGQIIVEFEFALGNRRKQKERIYQK